MHNFLTLYIKEWKQNKWLFLIGIGVVIGIFIFFRKLSDSSYMRQMLDPTICFYLLIPVFLAIGSGLFAGEKRDGTLNFILNSPIKKSEIWLSKFILGITQIIIIILVIIALDDFRFKYSMGYLYNLITSGFFIFSCGIVMSILLNKPLLSFFAGILLCILFWIGNALIWGLFIICSPITISFVIILNIVSFLLFTKYRR